MPLSPPHFPDSRSPTLGPDSNSSSPIIVGNGDEWDDLEDFGIIGLTDSESISDSQAQPTAQKTLARNKVTITGINVGKKRPPLSVTDPIPRITKRKRFYSEDIVILSERRLSKTLRSLDIDEGSSKQQPLDAQSILPLYYVDQNVELRDGSFLRIKLVSEEEQMVAGLHMRRLKSLESMPRQRDELAWVADVSEDDYKEGVRSQLKEVPMSEIQRERAIIFTNIPKSQDSKHPPTTRLFQDSKEGASLKTLYCRWKIIKITREVRGSIKVTEVAYMHLNEEAADSIYRDKDSNIRSLFRGGRKLPAGGSFVRKVKAQSINLVENDGNMPLQSETFEKDECRYGLGDTFSGTGGVTQGAIQAGLFVVFGCDRDEAAFQSHRVNFEGLDTISLRLCISDFIKAAGATKVSNFWVEILHISFPCKAFSGVNTRGASGKYFEDNQATLFATEQLLSTLKPRVVTMEQTDHLISRHPEFFRALKDIFTSAGYALRYRVLKCEQYGVAQTRKRLIIFASAPGEALVEFPSPTHGPGTGREYNYIGNAISDIPPTATHHDPDSRRFKEPKEPFSANTFAKTITCGGGENYHPSGLRGYTAREYARIQGFPDHHVFCNKDGELAGFTIAVEQIGNAVPPILAKVLFRAVIKSLKKTDNVP